MYFTEKVATTQKLCPQLLATEGLPQSCYGSACMAWEWQEVTWQGNGRRQAIKCQQPHATIEPAPRPANVPENWIFCPAEDDAACWVEPKADANNRRVGRCGLVPLEPRIEIAGIEGRPL